MEIKNKKLAMKFDPLVIDDLGAKLYSTLPPVIAELIANAYDACAKNVWIELIGDGEDKKIIIRDDGTGMTFEEISSNYLIIGKKKRETGGETTPCGRLPIGKKGLGKLAFFGIAKKATIETISDGKKVKFNMDWDEIQKVPEGQSYEPKFIEEIKNVHSGTCITLQNLFKKTDFLADNLRKSISNYFIFDDDFKVFIKSKDDVSFKEISNEARYDYHDRRENFSWGLPESVVLFKLDKDFPFALGINGKVITFDKPVDSKIRGVTLFSRKKLVNLPEFFPVQGSSHFFQYLTGWIEVDFIDELRPDVIATNRSSLNWNDDNLQELKRFLEYLISAIHLDWRRKMQAKATEEIKKKFKIDVTNWKDSNKNNPTISKNILKFTEILNEPEKIEESSLMEISEIIYDLAPENAEFMLWRNLNRRIKENPIIKERFFGGKYLEAAREAVQIYNECVQEISGYSEDGYTLMEKSYGKDDHKIIWVTKKSNESERNIDEGQKLLSQGVMVGFKNPAVSHTSITKGYSIKDFSDKNCLDILTTLSYLFDRLDNRQSPTPTK